MAIARPRKCGPLLSALAACALVAWLAVPAAFTLAQETTQPSLFLMSPGDDEYMSGPSLLRAVLVPAGTPFERVSFFADGRLVCTIETLPLECPWDAGLGIKEHQVRVVAFLPGGRRLSDTVRTRAVEYAETVDVDVVQLTVAVTDENGEFVKGLPRSAFRIYEDDKPAPISFFVAENVPLELITALDISGSMTDSLPQVKVAAKAFLSEISQRDKVTVLGFNENVFTVARSAVDVATRQRAVDRLGPWGGTSLYEVVAKSLDMLGRERGRRAVVVFTDGEDTTSRLPFEAVEGRAEVSDATLYMIGQGRGTEAADLKTVMERLATRSGGRAFFTTDPDKLGGVFRQILEELSNQYLLGFVPRHTRADTRWHTLRVELPGHKRYKVRTRQGYRMSQAK